MKYCHLREDLGPLVRELCQTANGTRGDNCRRNSGRDIEYDRHHGIEVQQHEDRRNEVGKEAETHIDNEFRHAT